VHYSDHYEEKGVFERLMTRLRNIMPGAQGYIRPKTGALPSDVADVVNAPSGHTKGIQSQSNKHETDGVR
jgi:hypothetical protein